MVFELQYNQSITENDISRGQVRIFRRICYFHRIIPEATKALAFRRFENYQHLYYQKVVTQIRDF
jgi:hypothetical protein